jgi:hypothetical protein
MRPGSDDIKDAIRFHDFPICLLTGRRTTKIEKVTGTLMKSAHFGATKIANFSASSEVLRGPRARLTTNPLSVSHACRWSRSAKQRQPTMARIFFNRRGLAVMAAMALPLVATACFALSIRAGANTPLQDIADDAALAGVNSLAGDTDQPADARSAAAIAAARTIIASRSVIIPKLHPSIEGLTMSVVVEDADTGTRISAIAKYIPAKDSRPVRRISHPLGYTAAAL